MLIIAHLQLAPVVVFTTVFVKGSSKLLSVIHHVKEDFLAGK